MTNLRMRAIHAAQVEPIRLAMIATPMPVADGNVQEAPLASACAPRNFRQTGRIGIVFASLQVYRRLQQVRPRSHHAFAIRAIDRHRPAPPRKDRRVRVHPMPMPSSSTTSGEVSCSMSIMRASPSAKPRSGRVGHSARLTIRPPSTTPTAILVPPISIAPIKRFPTSRPSPAVSATCSNCAWCPKSATFSPPAAVTVSGAPCRWHNRCTVRTRRYATLRARNRWRRLVCAQPRSVRWPGNECRSCSHPNRAAPRTGSAQSLPANLTACAGSHGCESRRLPQSRLRSACAGAPSRAPQY